MVFGKMLDTQERQEDRERERDRIVTTARGPRRTGEVKERKPGWTSEAFERDKKRKREEGGRTFCEMARG